MGLLGNSRSRTALGGSLGARRTLGGYKLNDKAALAEKAQSSVASTAKAMSKKGQEKESKVSDLGKASLGLSALDLGAKVYGVANTPDKFGDMDYTAQQEYLKTLSPESQEKFVEMNAEKMKASPTEMAKTEMTKGADISGTSTEVTPAGDSNITQDPATQGSTGPDTPMTEGKEMLDGVESVATGADEAQLVSEAGTIGEGVESIAAIGDGLEVVDAGTTALDTTSALGFFV